MINFLAIQNTYTHVQMGVFYGTKPIATIEIDKKDASKACINALETLLVNCSMPFNDLAFIAVNQGPGPFTTLRVVIATVNGLGFTQKKPLIGINALEAFLSEYADQPTPTKVVLLNAFAHDLYFGIQTAGFIETGCATAASCFLEISQKIPHGPILFLGNGITGNQSLITDTFGHRVVFLSINPETVSLSRIAKMGLDEWINQKNLKYQLEPLYYKSTDAVYR
jgi:tRNA threonylcarbamoyladenosine biosynthesis protein TsaB